MSNDNRHIWIIEDEENICDFLTCGLMDNGYQVSTFENGLQAWQHLEEKSLLPQLMLLDIKMPGMNGLELCSLIRRHFGFSMPIIMLTALGTTEDIVAGLQAGADDYVVKPFSFAEVLARIESALRRSIVSSSDTLVYNDLRIDVKSHKAWRDGKEFNLSIKELRLLTYMVEHSGILLSRSQLLKDVWDRNFETNTNVVDVYIRYLREKIDTGFSTRLIHTVVGVGYVLK